MTDDEDLHEEAEEIRAKTAKDAPEVAEHDHVAELERQLEEAKQQVLYAAAENQNVRRRLSSEMEFERTTARSPVEGEGEMGGLGNTDPCAKTPLSLRLLRLLQ